MADIDPEFWIEGFTMFQTWNSPWVSMLDHGAFRESARTIEQLGVTTIAGAHTPTIPSTHLDQAFEMLRAMPTTPAPPMPDQGALDHMLATLQG